MESKNEPQYFQSENLLRRIYDIASEKLEPIKNKLTSLSPKIKEAMIWSVEPWYSINRLDETFQSLGKRKSIQIATGPIFRDYALSFIYLGLKGLITGNATLEELLWCLGPISGLDYAIEMLTVPYVHNYLKKK